MDDVGMEGGTPAQNQEVAALPLRLPQAKEAKAPGDMVQAQKTEDDDQPASPDAHLPDVVALDSESGNDSETKVPVTPDDTQTNIEVAIVDSGLMRDEYEEVQSEVVERVHGSVGSDLWEIEFRNGVIKRVPWKKLIRLENGAHSLETWTQTWSSQEASTKAAMGYASELFDKEQEQEQEDEDDLGDEDDNNLPRARTRRSRRVSRVPSRISSVRGLESEEDDDELTDSRALRRSTRPGNSRSRQGSRVSSGDESDGQRNGEQEVPAKGSGRRTLRPRTITSLVPKQGSQEIDELAQDQPQTSSGESDFQIIRSDLAPAPRRGKIRKWSKRIKAATGRANPRGGGGGGGRGTSDIEMEPARRSGRANRNQKNLNEAAFDQDAFQEDRVVGAPKIAAIKEVFKPVSEETDFALLHVEVCMLCRIGPNRTITGGQYGGPLIFCQGCSYSFHKPCIGIRSARDHLATKLGPDDFVLQCRVCIGAKASNKDHMGSQPDVCQDCGKKGASCAPFSKKLTAKQEESLRKQNEGDDPSTAVAPALVNNPDNVLFRCIGCKRGWHFQHLPPFKEKQEAGTESDLTSERDRRLKEYSGDWKCRECLTYTRKIETIVAWRLIPSKMPRQMPSRKAAPAFDKYTGDDKEFLVKWENRSYFHCIWLPGAFMAGACQGQMRMAFARKALYEGRFARDEEEAIPDDYLTAEIILDVKYGRSALRAKSIEDEMARIDDVSKIYVKFVGLAYEQVVWDAPPSKESGQIYSEFRSAYLEYVKGRHFKNDGPVNIRHRVKEFRAAARPDNLEFLLKEKPEEMAPDLKLMKYQLEGVNWLLQKYRQSENGILADEMGLGKTLQVLTFISALAFREPRAWPFLVVVPNSTCPNWRRETKRFAPNLRIVTYHGGRVAQDLAYRYELFPNGSRDLKAHLVVMSYDSAQDERTWTQFKHIAWAGLVVDEGQRLKNDKNLLYKALGAIKFPFKLLLTGTPVQNNKRELFNLLQFVDKTQDAEALDEEYMELTDAKLRELHGFISPYVLRRTKAQVLKFLPPCENIIVPVTMTILQQKVYKSILSKSPELLRAIFSHSRINKKERGSLNNILMQLRKCLAHPFIYSDNLEDDEVEFEVEHRKLIEASAKLKLLEVMLPKLRRPTDPDKPPHRVLIFSQFLNQLDIIEDFLNGLGLPFRRLDGTMSSLEKQKRIDDFNNNPDIFAFLLSTRAGGVGINLATADTVIIMDPDFNPHQDLQASSRAHRIGQQNPVLVIQLMTRKTVEERIMQMGKKKMALDFAVIERMDAADENEDLEGILRHGADELFGQNEPETIRYTSASVDKLLESRPVKKTRDAEAEREAENEAGAAKAPDQVYNYGQVWSSDKGGLLDLGDPGEAAQISEDAWAEVVALREKEHEARLKQQQEILGRGGRKRQVVNYRTGGKLNGLDPGVLSDSDANDHRNDDFGADDSSSSSSSSSDSGSEAGTRGDRQQPPTSKRKGEEGVAGPPPKKARKARAPQVSSQAQSSKPVQQPPAATSQQQAMVLQEGLQQVISPGFAPEPPGWLQSPISSKSPGLYLQAIRNTLSAWNEVEALRTMLNPATVAVLQRLEPGNTHAWWIHLTAPVSHMCTLALRDIWSLSRGFYGGPHLRDLLRIQPMQNPSPSTGQSSNNWPPPPAATSSSQAYHAHGMQGNHIWNGQHNTQQQQQLLQQQINMRQRQQQPQVSQTATAQMTSTSATRTQLRLQLDNLKFTQLPPEEMTRERERLKRHLRSLEGGGGS